MRKLSAYNFITLNGFFKGENQDISWHKHGEEENDFSEKNLEQGNILLFGRVTYEMMAAFWPTPRGKEAYPLVAEGMNKAEKIVFSNSLQKADWNNTRIITGNIVKEIKEMKQAPGNNMTILGSGTIVARFAEAGLIDEYQIMVDPVVIPKGTSIFAGISRQLDLKLKSTRRLKSGVILINYEPA